MDLMKRKKQHRNFLPAFLLTLLVWLGWLYFFISFPPETKLLISIFYLFLFLANFLTFSLILGNSRRGFLISSAIISYLFLNQMKQAHVLNFILIGGILLSIELYFRKCP